MTQKSAKRSKGQSPGTTAPLSNRPAATSNGSIIVTGRPPAERPARVIDFEELDKKALDVLVDALKYVATTSGIVIAMYSQSVREYVKLPAITTRPLAQVLVFLPLLLWLTAIVGTVLGIFPREYQASTDAEKERAIRQIRASKQKWLKTVLIPFLLGFGLLVYIVAAQIWSIFPFA